MTNQFVNNESKQTDQGTGKHEIACPASNVATVHGNSPKPVNTEGEEEVMTGTTKIDFVGTMAEAKNFATQHKDMFPRTFGLAHRELKTPNGDMQLCASWRNNTEREQVRKSLTSLGWAGDWEEVVHTPKQK